MLRVEIQNPTADGDFFLNVADSCIKNIKKCCVQKVLDQPTMYMDLEVGVTATLKRECCGAI